LLAEDAFWFQLIQVQLAVALVWHVDCALPKNASSLFVFNAIEAPYLIPAQNGIVEVHFMVPSTSSHERFESPTNVNPTSQAKSHTSPYKFKPQPVIEPALKISVIGLHDFLTQMLSDPDHDPSARHILSASPEST